MRPCSRAMRLWTSRSPGGGGGGRGKSAREVWWFQTPGMTDGGVAVWRLSVGSCMRLAYSISRVQRGRVHGKIVMEVSGASAFLH